MHITLFSYSLFVNVCIYKLRLQICKIVTFSFVFSVLSCDQRKGQAHLSASYHPLLLLCPLVFEFLPPLLNLVLLG